MQNNDPRDDPRPSFLPPRGTRLSRDEQNRIDGYFRQAVKGDENERRSGRVLLDKALRSPNPAASRYAMYRLRLLDWLTNHPGETIYIPVEASNTQQAGDELQYRFLRSLYADTDRARSQTKIEDSALGSDMWSELPVIRDGDS